MAALDSGWKNKLFFGDNLDLLRKDIPAGSVDLIYLDPPFNSNASYNVLFKEKKTGKQSAAQITAFEDTWHWTLAESESAYEEVVKSGHQKLSDLIQAMRRFLGESDMMAYLVMMAVRLIELHRVLKLTGSIYLHCDTTASHYLKLVMDALFHPENFRSEVTWKRTNIHNDSKDWSDVADILLYYVKDAGGGRYIWNPIYLKHEDAYVKTKYRYDDGDGRLYRLDNMTSPNPRPNMMYEWNGFPCPPMGWRYSKETMAKLDAEGRVWYPTDKKKRPQLKRYLEEMRGTVVSNVWTDIPPINSQAQERMGYQTQKPEALLERILNASSNEGDTVLDPFCGCGTAVAVAERLHRRWIGIDITHLAIDLIVRRLKGIEGACPYTIAGYPEDVSGAESLAGRDKYQFQWWAVIKAGGDWSSEMKKGMDRGIDGSVAFFDDYSGQAKKVIIQVKGGQHPNVNDVRVLRSVIEREKAPIGALITLKPVTREMSREAAAAGVYEPEHFRGRKFPRIQILTVEDLFAGKRIEHPELAISGVKPAEKKTKDRQQGLF
jgi:site-specific DNA-methyltransferase (adenine-specific)